MRKYYITFIVLTLVVIAAVIKAFTVSGSPFTQKALSFDAQRLSTMSSLKYSIDSFYQDGGQLPKSLDELSYVSSKVDPETQKPIDYKVLSGTTYSLCTTFSTDTKDPSSKYRQYNNTQVAGSTFYHSKGYDCIELKAPTVYTRPTPFVQKEPQTNSFSFFGTIDSIAKSDKEPRIIVKDNTQVIRIFFLSEAEVLNKDGETTNYESFAVGDKVIVDAPQSGSYNSYKATKVQNLSR